MRAVVSVVVTLLIFVGIWEAGKHQKSVTDDTNTFKSQVLDVPVKPAETNTDVKYTTKTITNLNVSPDQVVYFDTEVDALSVDIAIGLLTKMSKNYNTLYLLINSPGGSVFDGIRLISFIESSPVKIKTVCVFICASMAAHLHQSGEERLMEDSGLLMFHPAAGGLRGQIENMGSQLSTIQKIVNGLDAKASKRSNIPYDEFKRKVAFEFWLNPMEAVSTKLTDRLVYIRTGDAEKLRGTVVSKELEKYDPVVRFLKGDRETYPNIILENKWK